MSFWYSTKLCFLSDKSSKEGLVKEKPYFTEWRYWGELNVWSSVNVKGNKYSIQCNDGIFFVAYFLPKSNEKLRAIFSFSWFCFRYHFLVQTIPYFAHFSYLFEYQFLLLKGKFPCFSLNLCRGFYGTFPCENCVRMPFYWVRKFVARHRFYRNSGYLPWRNQLDSGRRKSLARSGKGPALDMHCAGIRRRRRS